MVKDGKKQTHKGEIQAIRKLVHSLGGFVNVTHQSGIIHGSAGVPDLYVQIPAGRAPFLPDGGTFWFEVKVGKDKLRPAQEEFIARQGRCFGRFPVLVLVGDLDALKLFLGIDIGKIADVTGDRANAWAQLNSVRKLF